MRRVSVIFLLLHIVMGLCASQLSLMGSGGAGYSGLLLFDDPVTEAFKGTPSALRSCEKPLIEYLNKKGWFDKKVIYPGENVSYAHRLISRTLEVDVDPEDFMFQPFAYMMQLQEFMAGVEGYVVFKSENDGGVALSGGIGLVFPFLYDWELDYNWVSINANIDFFKDWGHYAISIAFPFNLAFIGTEYETFGFYGSTSSYRIMPAVTSIYCNNSNTIRLVNDVMVRIPFVIGVITGGGNLSETQVKLPIKGAVSVAVPVDDFEILGGLDLHFEAEYFTYNTGYYSDLIYDFASNYPGLNVVSETDEIVLNTFQMGLNGGIKTKIGDIGLTAGFNIWLFEIKNAYRIIEGQSVMIGYESLVHDLPEYLFFAYREKTNFSFKLNAGLSVPHEKNMYSEFLFVFEYRNYTDYALDSFYTNYFGDRVSNIISDFSFTIEYGLVLDKSPGNVI